MGADKTGKQKKPKRRYANIIRERKNYTKFVSKSVRKRLSYWRSTLDICGGEKEITTIIGEMDVRYDDWIE